MSIVLRNLKGSALTYTEMDRNQSQFFYSASLADAAPAWKVKQNKTSLIPLRIKPRLLPNPVFSFIFAFLKPLDCKINFCGQPPFF